MSYESVRAAVAAYVSSNWAAAATGVPIEFDNITQIDHEARVDPFVTFQMRWRLAEQASLDVDSVTLKPIARRDGEVLFHIHVPGGRGTKPATTLADALAGFMEFVRVSNVQFQAARLMPPVDYKAWQIYPLALSFFYRE